MGRYTKKKTIRKFFKDLKKTREPKMTEVDTGQIIEDTLKVGGFLVVLFAKQIQKLEKKL